jgi:hypothetical protein
LPLVFGLLTLSLVAAAAGGWFFFGSPAAGSRQRSPAASSPPPISEPPAKKSEPAAPPASLEQRAPQVQAVEPPSATSKATVRLSIVTEPTGALVQKDGFQICDASPCELEVDSGAAVTLVARKGAQSGQAKVLAHKDQAVLIVLRAPAKKASAQKKLCEVTVDGLKILRPCE